jgi:amicyanin
LADIRHQEDAMHHRISSVVVTLVVLAILATPASAGGWAHATVAHLPTGMVAERGTYIDIQVMQHGITPFEGANPALTAVNMASGTEYTAQSRESEIAPGVYRFQITLPEAGWWKWWVTNDPFPGITTFSPLYVNPAATESTPSASSPGDVIIVMRDVTFQPSLIEITAGTTVTWVNTDVVSHQVSSGQTLWFADSPMLATGESYSFTFEEPGTFDYVCGPHPGMAGQVVVR